MRLTTIALLLFVFIATPVLAEDCDLTVAARDTDALIAEVPAIDAALSACPMPIPSAVSKIVKGDLQINIARDDGTTTNIFLTTRGQALSSAKVGTGTCLRQVDVSETTLDTILGSGDRATTLQALYARGDLKARGCTMWTRMTTAFLRPISKWFVKSTLPPPPAQQTVPAAQDGSLLCDFYNGPTKKIVTCGAYMAGDTFCANVMGSPQAKAVTCEENGLVLCSVPCGTYSAVKLTDRCAFDINRARGTQAPPIGECPAVQAPAAGKKEPGEVCQHGGECRTGNCVGVGQGPPWVYQCSCDPFKFVGFGC